MSIRTTRIVYWTFTMLFLIPQTWSAIQMLARAPRMTETITELGYPMFVMTMLGTAKLLGAAAILLSDRWPTLKEWAYAGFTFDVAGAFISHLAHGDSALIVSVPALFLVAQLASYFSWKRLMQLGLAHPAVRTRIERRSDTVAAMRGA
jgi:hypothetical protein